jgi:hypothetical protein
MKGPMGQARTTTVKALELTDERTRTKHGQFSDGENFYSIQVVGFFVEGQNQPKLELYEAIFLLDQSYRGPFD